MIKGLVVLEEVTEQHKYCDVCGAEICIGLACTSARCEYCKKDLCEDCIGHEESDYSDSRSVWCKRCWGIGEGYRSKIKALNDEKDALYEEWRGKCGETSK